MPVITVGDLVKASFKSGEYIGEVVELTERKAAVRVLAVLKHPAQGDLHHPRRADVNLFHQRRALAYQEIALMPLPTLLLYSGVIPDYKQSLKAALELEIGELREQLHYASRALDELRILQQDYFSREDSGDDK
ncbi:sporulation phosphorelay system protein KapB [Gorillibacterium timonense]|uniref:sporulation phosphorelay system protein KapB n=1 Tax=Gorillibacterium timonense TaxID=1689269 RepID=UPI00071D83C5|nr:sporulation phosphorelay system protein KapB [Gorillibacterium timonense]